MTACATTEDVMSVQDVVSGCHVSTSIKGCEALDKQIVSIQGFLNESENLNRLYLAKKKIELDNYNPEEDGSPLLIEILSSQAGFPKYENFFGREVIVAGPISTKCVIEATKFIEEKIKDDKEGVVTIKMLTGACHYVTNPYMSVNAVEIKAIK